MADWQEQLNTILSDPDAMAQIASIAQSLGGGAAAEPKPDGASPPPPPPGMDAAQLLGSLDPELLRRLGPLLRELNRPESSEATALLMALRPFLSRKRRDKVERAFLTSEGGAEHP